MKDDFIDDDMLLFLQQFRARHTDTWEAYLALADATDGKSPRVAKRLVREFRKLHPDFTELVRAVEEGPDAIRAGWSRVQ